MTGREHAFDRAYWDEHHAGGGRAARHPGDPHPYLAHETADLAPGTALDAGCGEGREALWLVAHGWDVTAADIAPEVLRRARARAPGDAGGQVRWVEADLASWEPAARVDLVTTFYAHPTIPQLDFYDRLAGWVAPGGTLLVVGHGQGHGHGHGHGHEHRHGQGSADADGPPPEATVTAASVAARLDGAGWEVVTAEEVSRVVVREGGQSVLRDVVVRATRPTPPA